MDKEVKYIADQYADQFEKRINNVLKEGQWRVVWIKGSLVKNEFHAFLVRSDYLHETKQRGD